MEINKRDRTELKKFFEATDVPTHEQFGQLIDAGINQAEDGIAKIQGNPLALEAEGETGETLEVLSVFSSFANAQPDWSLELNPRVNSGDPETAQHGLNIKDVTGQNRLFIRSEDGSIGIGTIEPSAKLTVQDTGNGSMITALSDTEVPSRIFEISREEGKGMLALRADDGVLMTRLSGDIEKPSFFSGKVGIGTTNPQTPLQLSAENAILKVTNTGGSASNTARLGLYHDTGENSWEINGNRGGHLSFIPLANDSKKLVMRISGRLEAPGGISLSTGSRPGHREGDGALYRHSGQVYLTVDDHFYIRDKDLATKIHFNTHNGRLALGGENPEAPLSINGSGKENAPNASMHITNQCILFGGNNAGKNHNSAKISAGTHVPNSLNFVGMASGISHTDRKVDIFSEGGTTVRGSLHPQNYIHHVKTVMFSAYLGSQKSGTIAKLNFDKISNNLGNGYSAGTFTAPVKGVYMLTIALRTFHNGQLRWQMKLDPANGGATTFVNAGSKGEKRERAGLIHINAQYSSRTVMTQLNAGDKVFIFQQVHSGTILADNYSSGFEGMLLYATP